MEIAFQEFDWGKDATCNGGWWKNIRERKCVAFPYLMYSSCKRLSEWKKESERKQITFCFATVWECESVCVKFFDMHKGEEMRNWKKGIGTE